MSRLNSLGITSLGLTVLFSVFASPLAHATVIDSFAISQTTGPVSVTSALGTAERNLDAVFEPSTIEISGNQFATTGDVGSINFISYYYFPRTNLSPFESLALNGVTVTGNALIQLKLVDDTGAEKTVDLTENGGSYSTSLSPFWSDIDVAQIESIVLLFKDTGSPFSVTASSLEITPAVAPEPGSCALLASAGAFLLLIRRRARITKA
jgi:hypothetical protein